MKPTLYLAGAALTASSIFQVAALQAVETDPVGYVTTTTPNGDDALIGLPLAQAAALASAVDSIVGAEVTITPTLVADAYNNTHYALATSGVNAGQWSEIVDTGVNSITTAEVLLAANDTFDVIPFWTLGTAFPNGAGIGAVANPSIPDKTVSLNNPAAVGTNLSTASTYFYFVGGPSGDVWYEAGTFASSNGVVLSPETYITIRNNGGAPLDTVVSGAVPTTVVGTTVIGYTAAAQDNQLVNPYPAAITLAGSGLDTVVAPSPNPSVPLDSVLIYDIEASSGTNISAASTYFYFIAGPSGEGWYEAGTFAFSDTVEIPAGGAFIVRKGAGNDETLTWNPPLPYTL